MEVIVINFPSVGPNVGSDIGSHNMTAEDVGKGVFNLITSPVSRSIAVGLANAKRNSDGKNTVDTSKASIWDAIGNHFTGNLDYQRQVESAVRAEDRSALEAQKAREFSAKEAQKAREWSEMMSNTAYSRAIADLKANGINPYAIGLYSPASTPAATNASSYSGAGFVGSAPSTAQGVSQAINFIQTAYKESNENRRANQAAMNKLLDTVLSLFFKF